MAVLTIVGFSVLGLVLLFAIAMLVLNRMQGKLVCSPEPYATPPAEGKPETPLQLGMDFQDLEITSKDGTKLHGWFVPSNPNPQAQRTLLYFHGVGGNVQTRLPTIEFIVKKVHMNVLIVDYRGFGKSPGSPNEQGIYADAEATVEYALTRTDIIDTDKLYAFGTSLGGAIVINTALSKGNHLKGIVVENTFLSLSQLLDDRGGPVSWIRPCALTMKFPTNERIGRITTSILFLWGEADKLVPAGHMQGLIDLAYKDQKHSAVVDVVKFKEGEHNEMWKVDEAKYADAFKDFFGQCEN